MGRRCFQVIAYRQWSAPAAAEAWDVERCNEVFRNKFTSLRAAIREPNLDRRVWYSASGIGVELEETVWESDCDDDGRECRDVVIIERCNGMPLSWAEYTTVHRLLGVPRETAKPYYERAWQQKWLHRHQREL